MLCLVIMANMQHFTALNKQLCTGHHEKAECGVRLRVPVDAALLLLETCKLSGVSFCACTAADRWLYVMVVLVATRPCCLPHPSFPMLSVHPRYALQSAVHCLVRVVAASVPWQNANSRSAHLSG